MEWNRQREAAALDRDLPFGHGFEQRRLGLRRRAVDLVREEESGEDRAGTEHEVGLGGRVDERSGDIGRQ